jgi:hypothetical protein
MRLRGLRKTGSAALAFALVAGSAWPLRATEAGATSLFGTVPTTVRVGSSQVVSEKVGGERVGTIPTPTDGKFTFANLAAGDYVVRVLDASGSTVIQSEVARVQPDTAVEVHFDESQTPGLPPLGGSAVGHSGISRTAVILSGALIAGVTTAVVLVANGDEPRPASPSR